MRVLRYGQKGLECPVLLDTEGEIRDLSSVICDLSGAADSSESLAKLRELNLKTGLTSSGTKQDN